MHLSQLITRISPKLPLLPEPSIPKALMVDTAALAPAPNPANPTTLYLDQHGFSLNEIRFSFTTDINVLSVLIEIGAVLMSATKVQSFQNPLALTAIAADFDIILQAAASELDAPLILLDLSGQHIIAATSSTVDAHSPVGRFLAAQEPALDPNQFYQHMYLTNPNESPTPLLLTPIAYQSEPLGYLAIVTTTPLTARQTRLLPAFARVITCASIRDKVIVNSLSQRDRLVSLLLTEQQDSTFKQQFENQGAILPTNMVLIKCEPTANQSLATLEARLTYLMIPMFTQVLITIHHHACLALVTISLPEYNQPNFVTQLTTIATRGKCRLIVSNFYRHANDTSAAYQVCNRAARLKNDVKPVLFCSDVFFDLMLTQVSNRDNILPFFIDSSLKVLTDYDQANHTELVATLRAYLLATCNLTATAETLFIHPNTLRKRMQHITHLTGLNLKDAKTCFKLAASLEVSRYLMVNHLNR